MSFSRCAYKRIHAIASEITKQSAILFFSTRRAKLFRFDSESAEWKERGTGDVRLLSHRETKKVRLVMRRDKTLKVCANHVSEYICLVLPYLSRLINCCIVSADMRLQPNIGSDRSWVWKVAADYSEQPPTSETLAIRFANSDSKSCGPSCILGYQCIPIF